MGDQPNASWDITRRQLLVGTAAVLAVGVTGCASDDGGDDAVATTTATGPPVELSGDPFTLGVASGDPRPDSVILWTRLALEPLAEDGLGGMPAQSVDVAWEVATDEAFTDVVASGTATAAPTHAHAVHVDVNGLTPASDYHYRFTVGDHVSPVARTRTLPDGSPDAFALAVVNCQWFEAGTYAAYRHLVDEDVDLVVHLGDYIYESAGAGIGAGERSTVPTHQLETLADYRLRYACYRQDQDLQQAHHRHPFVLTWDDHEVANNYMGDTLEPTDEAGGTAAERKTAAYQAWWEHLPVRVDPPTDGELAVYQAVDIGDLARLCLLDQRQYSDPPPCRDVVEGDVGDCPERTTGDRARLGDEQEAWLEDALTTSTATWNLIGNPVVLAGIDGGNDADGPRYYLDAWDGFPSARHRLIKALAAVDNPVVLTGDYHAGMVLDVHERPFEDSPVVAPEFMAPPISSPLFPADVSARTPQLTQQLNGHGYLKVQITPEDLKVTFRVLDDVQDPDSAIYTLASYWLAAGSHQAQQL